MLENRQHIDIHVIPQDFLKAERGIAERCPIRYALARYGFHAPKVPWNGERGYIRLTDPDTGIRHEWEVPPLAFLKLTEWDKFGTDNSFHFRLDMFRAVKTGPRKSVTVAASTAKPKTKEFKGTRRPINPNVPTNPNLPDNS